jgi:hypothetical protein
VTEESGAEIDRLIRELIRTRRAATSEEITQIVERIATAPFDPRMQRVKTTERGVRYGDYQLRRDTPSLIYHLVKRVVMERQWAEGTSTEQYLGDLRRAVRMPSAHLGLFQRRGGSMAATVSLTRLVVPRERRTPRSLPRLLVVFSADRGCIVSGYQVTGLATIALPKEVVWLT